MRTLAPRARPQILAHRQLQTRTYADDKRGKDAEGTFTEYKPSQDGFADEESAEDVVAEATSTEGISLHGIPADENEQDEWIVKQERMKMIELAKKLRAKSIHLKNLRTYAYAFTPSEMGQAAFN